MESTLFQRLKQAQQANGLEHNDFERYRNYCSRKLQSLRTVLKAKQIKAGKGIHRRVPTPDDVAIDPRFLLITLFEAERAWAYGMQLKEEAQSLSRKKFHMVKRFKKARTFARSLNNLVVGSSANLPTEVASLFKLESQAYLCYLSGLAFTEEKNWSLALENFSGAKKLLSALLDHNQSLYQEKMDAMEPFIRFCTYNLQRMDASDEDLTGLMELQMNLKDSDIFLDSQIDDLMEKSRKFKSNSASHREYTACGSSVSCGNAKLNMILLQASSLKTRGNSFDRILQLYSSALQLAKEEKDPLLLDYIHMNRLETCIERDLSLIPSEAALVSPNTVKKRKWREFVKLTDNIIAALAEISLLNLVKQGSSDSLSTRLEMFSLLRLFFLIFAFKVDGKLSEAMAVISVFRQKLSTISARDSLNEKEAEKLKIITSGKMTGTTMTELELSIQIDLLSSSHSSQTKDEEEAKDESLSLASKLIHLPAPCMPIPVKPIFFDNALNDVEAEASKIEAGNSGNASGGGVMGSLLSSLGLKKLI